MATTFLIGALVAAVFLGLRRLFRVDLVEGLPQSDVPDELQEWRARRQLEPLGSVRRVNGGRS